jgi:predicted dehydrogenase
VNYCYSAYPMVREMRADGAHGRDRESPPGRHEFQPRAPWRRHDADNPRVRWRYDPAMAGVSGQFADCGIHALHMASFIVGDQVDKVSADFASTIPSGCWKTTRWSISAPRAARSGGFGPHRSPSGGSTGSTSRSSARRAAALGVGTAEPGEANLSDEADRTSRVTIGHAEGMPLAFANIYKDLAEAIRAEKQGRAMDPAANLYPRAEDGLRSMAAVFAVAESGKADGIWVDARPPMFR